VAGRTTELLSTSTKLAVYQLITGVCTNGELYFTTERRNDYVVMNFRPRKHRYYRVIGSFVTAYLQLHTITPITVSFIVNYFTSLSKNS